VTDVDISPAPEVTGRRSADLVLTLDARAAGTARRSVRTVLVGWGLGDDGLVADAALVVSELVTNAVRHGGDQLGLELGLDPDPAGATVRVAVRDGSAVLPRPQAVDDEQEGGRGLGIVAAVAADWGTETTATGGKRVWALLRPPPGPGGD
jgi:anti-sigma regulatory factor (Ser/Thr protein kinase)